MNITQTKQLNFIIGLVLRTDLWKDKWLFVFGKIFCIIALCGFLKIEYAFSSIEDFILIIKSLTEITILILFIFLYFKFIAGLKFKTHTNLRAFLGYIVDVLACPYLFVGYIIFFYKGIDVPPDKINGLFAITLIIWYLPVLIEVTKKIFYFVDFIKTYINSRRRNGN